MKSSENVYWSFGGGRYRDVIDALHRARSSQLVMGVGAHAAELQADWALLVFSRWCIWRVADRWTDSPKPEASLFYRAMTGDEPSLKDLKIVAQAAQHKLVSSSAGHAVAEAVLALRGQNARNAHKAAWAVTELTRQAGPDFRMERAAHRATLKRWLIWAACASGGLKAEAAPFSKVQREELAVASDEVLEGQRDRARPPPWILAFEPALLTKPKGENL